jgi:peroxiredoxin Q/BCP
MVFVRSVRKGYTGIMIALHAIAPDFSLLDQEGITHTLSQYLGKKVLIYFYPKDDTPGCTTEACSFRDNYKMLSEAGLVILGISKDAVKSHKKFAEKYKLPFPLLADEDTKVCEAYGVWGLKKFMGREYMGIDRKSFLIDEEGNIAKIYNDVKPKEHVREISQDLV